VADEGAMAGQRLVQRDAERELIGARLGHAEAFAIAGARAVAVEGGGQELGREVGRRADQRAGAGQDVDRTRGGGAERRGGVAVVDQAEVGDAHAAVIAEHRVGRLEVAVDQAGLMRGQEALAGGAEHREDLGRAARRRGQPLVDGGCRPPAPSPGTARRRARRPRRP
jgi:hypothetical protein